MTPAQWILGGLGAVLVGVSKTGMPGAGILVVPLLASAFGARPSVGVMLPMLLLGDVFAVAAYRQHAQWDKLLRLVPWVAVGLVAAAAMLQVLGHHRPEIGPWHKDIMNVVIGLLVLAMLGLHLARGRWGDKLAPTSTAGAVVTGGLAGFATTASNAAGPIMGIYLQAMGMPKEQFMGTTAWFFALVNATKLPVFAVISLYNPANPIISSASLWQDLLLAPVVLVGLWIGRWFLPRVPQKAFDALVLILAGLAAVNLLR